MTSNPIEESKSKKGPITEPTTARPDAPVGLKGTQLPTRIVIGYTLNHQQEKESKRNVHY